MTGDTRNYWKRLATQACRERDDANQKFWVLVSIIAGIVTGVLVRFTEIAARSL